MKKIKIDKKPEEVIQILKNIFRRSGYTAYFENVDIDLKDKDFIIVGTKSNLA